MTNLKEPQISGELESLIESKTKWGKDNGYLVDDKRMLAVCKGLLKTEGVCPCKAFRATNDDMKRKLTCPCFELEGEIKEKGKCTCGIYYVERKVC